MSDTSTASAVPAPQPRRTNTKWFAIGALAVAGIAFGIITAGGIGENLVYYWGPKDIARAGDKAVGATIRLGGMVAKDSIVHGQGSDLSFDVTDGEAVVKVRTSSVPPQMFREGIGVVVEGTMTDAGYFESRRLMVSHDNEYRAPGDGYEGDMQELMRTTRGMGGAEDGQANP